MAPSDPTRTTQGSLTGSRTLRRCAIVRKRFVETVERPFRVSYADAMDEYRVDIDKPWLSVADICEYMDVSTFVVTSVLRSGELPAVKFGREWRVSRDDFERWINEQRGALDSPETRPSAAAES